MEIWVVLDVDNNKVVKAFIGENAEFKAGDFGDDYYYSTGNDCVVQRTYLKRAD